MAGRDLPRQRHAIHLGCRRLGTDMRVEPASRSRHRVRRDLAFEGGILRPELLRIAFNAIDELLAGGAEIGRTGRKPVIAFVAGSRRPSVKILRPRKTLSDEL